MALIEKKLNLSLKQIADPQVLDKLDLANRWFGSILNAVKNIRIEFPKIYTVQGSVNVDRINMPPIEVKNLSDLNSGFMNLATGFKTMQDLLVSAIKNNKIEFPTSFNMQGMNDLLDAQEEIKKGFNLLLKSMQESKGSSDKPLQVEIIKDLPRPTTNPVTNISVNGLDGFAKSTSITVTTALTPLPSEVLSNRRSIIIYNNGSQTVEIGGSTFAFGGGVPIAAGTFSPAINAGTKLIVYGRVTTGSANVRVLEVSDIATGR